jgi:hypothetical protein
VAEYRGALTAITRLHSVLSSTGSLTGPAANADGAAVGKAGEATQAADLAFGLTECGGRGLGDTRAFVSAYPAVRDALHIDLAAIAAPRAIRRIASRLQSLWVGADSLTAPAPLEGTYLAETKAVQSLAGDILGEVVAMVHKDKAGRQLVDRAIKRDTATIVASDKAIARMLGLPG